MGWIADVSCPACGYGESDLMGIGHQVGDSGRICATVSCPAHKRLVDIEADCSSWGVGGEAGSSREMTPDEFRDAPPDPETGPCPLCGGTHVLWEKKTAVCPRCGKPGCTVDEVGFWD
jgi:hypothetical protein